MRALVIEDESDTTRAQLRILCESLGVTADYVTAEAALTEVTTTGVDAVLVGDRPGPMCFHDFAHAVAQVCERAGRPSPTVLRVQVDVLGQPTARTESDTRSVLDTTVLATLEADIGDRGFVLDTIEVFLTELPDRVVAITGALELGNTAEVRAVAHSLKSSSAMLGAMPLSEECADLEATARDGGRFKDPMSAASRLAELAARTEEALRGYLSGG
ncbi:MAG: Hpt domain-containing protein [Actinobacteria bacterium]|nr:Hpt domain-containing protein [Actinomycetota bacterium]